MLELHDLAWTHTRAGGLAVLVGEIGEDQSGEIANLQRPKGLEVEYQVRARRGVIRH